MYNDAYKQAFIKYMNIENNTYKRVVTINLEKASKYETMKQKDLSNFTVTEIEELYKSYLSRSLEGLNNVNCLYIKYTRYMLSQNLVADSQNHFEEIDSQLLKNCITIIGNSKIITSRDELYSDLNELDNPSDQFLALAMFEGISGLRYIDFWQLRMSDFKDGKVYLPNNRVLTVSNKLIGLAQLSADEYVYNVFNTGDTFNKYRTYAKDDDRIIKSIRKKKVDETERLNSQRIYNKIMRIKRFFGNNAFTPRGLNEGGRIYMIKEMMKKLDIKTPQELLLYHKDIRKELEIRYGAITNNSVKSYMLKYGEYFEGD